jgi:hypothetical protein
MPDDHPSSKPEWEERPDGSRVRIVNGIRIVDRSDRSQPPQGDGEAPPNGPIEHLVAHQEEGGRVVIIGLDAGCRAVYTTTLQRSLPTSD